MQTRLQAAWEHRGWLARLLWPVSVVFAALVAIRRQLYRWGLFQRHRLPVPVLTVGNMAVGGTGKTPMTVAIVQHLQAMGHHPVVVSRGYGGSARSPVRVDTLAPNPNLTGDEPLLLARLAKAPVWVGPDRVAVAQAALAADPQVNMVVLDDGMQHWRLVSDVLVVLFDQRGLGNRWLLPAGLLREPWPPTTWGATTFWVQTPGVPPASTQPLPSHLPVYTTTRRLASTACNRQGDTVDLAVLADRRPLGAVAGIAHPQRFFDMLEAQGLHLAHRRAAADHADTNSLMTSLTPGTCWLCTDKDAVKLFAAPTPPGATPLDIWAVGLETQTDPAFWTDLTQAVNRVVNGLSSRDGRKTA
ncbi:MAG: hypothetical protein RJA09_2278 [Pseudomonadota bacterium]